MIIEKPDLFVKLQNSYLLQNILIEEFNLFGIRNSNNMSEDIWNDILGLFTKLGKVYTWLGTTDPGVKATMQGKADGAAHLCIGFHKDIWQIGIHGKHNPNYAHTALIQTGNKVKIWRDKNKNFVNDEPTYEEGWYGINWHRASKWQNSPTIGNYSAGCQVTQDIDDFEFALDIILKSDKIGNNPDAKISYMLYENEIK